MKKAPLFSSGKWFITIYGMSVGMFRHKGSTSRDGLVAPPIWGVHAFLLSFGRGVYNPTGQWMVNGLTSTAWIQFLRFHISYSLAERRFV